MQATITEWMFVCITVRTLSYPQRCSLPPFLPPLPLLPLLSLSLPIICPFFIFFFLCSLSFLCPSLSLLLLFTLALSFVFSICLLNVLSILPLIPLAPLSPPPSSLSSYTSVSPPLFPSSTLSFRFFLLSFTSLSSRCFPVLPMLQQPLLLPLHLFFFRSLSFISFHCSLFSFLFLLPILPLPYLLFLLPLFLCSFFFLIFLIVLSIVSSLYSKTRLIAQTSRIRDAIYKPHEGT